MTAQTLSTPSTFPPARRMRLLLIAAGAAAVVVALMNGRALGLPFQMHTPDLSRLAQAAPVIQLHVTAAVTALLIGVVQLAGVKGTGVHRVLGWTWVVAMATVAISSFFIRSINPGHFSLIHLLSGWTLIALPMALVAIRRGKVRMHARGMTGMFVGGLAIAGLLTFLPGRLMWRVFFG